MITNTLSHTGTKRIHTLSSFLPCAGLRYCFSSRDSSAGREAFQTAQSWHTRETRLHSEAVKNPFRMYCRIIPKPVPKTATHINICSDSSLLSAGQYACFSLEFCTRLALDMSHSISIAHGAALWCWKQQFYVTGQAVLLGKVWSIYETYIITQTDYDVLCVIYWCTGVWINLQRTLCP